MRNLKSVVVAVVAAVPGAAVAGGPLPIDTVVEACRHAGNGFPPNVEPVKTELKAEASRVGMAYLNYIYQNDSANPHFCEAMLLMHAQMPLRTANPYVALFTPEHAVATMAALADVQLVFDYSIARSNPTAEKLKASLATLKLIIK